MSGEISLKHPSVTQKRTADAIVKAAWRAGMIAVPIYDGRKWSVRFLRPATSQREAPKTLTTVNGVTRTTVVALIQTLDAVGDLKDSNDVSVSVGYGPGELDAR